MALNQLIDIDTMFGASMQYWEYTVVVKREGVGQANLRVEGTQELGRPELASVPPNSALQQALEVLCWVAQGKTNPEIGRILAVGQRTVEAYLSAVYRRLGAEHRFAAIRCALTLLQGTSE